jgi:hypothetical protein
MSLNHEDKHPQSLSINHNVKYEVEITGRQDVKHDVIFAFATVFASLFRRELVDRRFRETTTELASSLNEGSVVHTYGC